MCRAGIGGASLFDRHAPRIHRYVARRTGREIADEVVAETFLAAFGKRERYDLSYRDAMPWLYGIATNLIGQHRRDEVRQFRIRQAAFPDLDVPGHAERVAGDVAPGQCVACRPPRWPSCPQVTVTFSS